MLGPGSRSTCYEAVGPQILVGCRDVRSQGPEERPGARSQGSSAPTSQWPHCSHGRGGAEALLCGPHVHGFVGRGLLGLGPDRHASSSQMELVSPTRNLCEKDENSQLPDFNRDTGQNWNHCPPQPRPAPLPSCGQVGEKVPSKQLTAAFSAHPEPED